MKTLLKSIKKEGDKELSCVFCMSKAKEAVIVLARRVNPKKLRDQLVKDAKEAGLALDVRSARFGRASVDDNDDTVLRITVNREPPGVQMHAQVKKRFRPVGFSDVVFQRGEAAPR